MKIFFYLIILILTFYNVFLGSTLVRNGEVNFFNDVARDFLLLQELDAKKIVLIGARSSTNGLFHGPLWTYLNYPSYLLSNGNPVVVAWFWIILGIIFLFTSFYMVKKLFGTLPALGFILLTSIKMAPHINGVFHSESTFFFIPFFFFTICMYVRSKKIPYLILHILSLAILIQLEVGIGLQFFILSILVIFWFIFKNKLWKHLYTFSLIPLFLSNFILFDFRNDFRMTKALISTGHAFEFFISIGSWVENRINNIISLQLIESKNDLFILIVFVLIISLTILQIRNKDKNQHIYSLFLFYYFGYIIMSFFNKGLLLFHYVYLLIPLTSLWLVSYLKGKYKMLFLFIIGFIYLLNLQNAKSYISSRQTHAGTNSDYNSWKALSEVASEVIAREKDKEFGYFVFAPDALAYQPRYAMIYNFKKAHAKAFEYVKKPITYIIAAPPPANDPYMNYVWWSKVPVKISSEPVEIKEFPSGFTIVKYNLSPDEQKIPHDKSIELGIHFR